MTTRKPPSPCTASRQPSRAVRVDRQGYVRADGTLIGKVEHDGGNGYDWSAYVQVPGRIVMRRVGKFMLKRDAVSEVVIMREA